MFLEKIMILDSEDTDYNGRSCKIKGSNKEEADEEMNHEYRSHIHQVKGIIGRIEFSWKDNGFQN